MTTAELASAYSTHAHGHATATQPPRVALIGEGARDLLAALSDNLVERCSLDGLEDVATDRLDVAVVDSEVMGWREPSPALVTLAARLPIIIVGPEADDDTGLERLAAVIGAASTIRRPVHAPALRRELRTLTELRRVRRALMVTNAALTHSVTGLAISDPRGDDTPIVHVSSTFEAITGYPAEDVIDKNCRFLQGPDTDPETVARLRHTIASRQPGRFVLRNYRKDGTPFWNELTIFPIFDEGGELLYIGGLQHDVTEVFNARAELARTKDQLAARHQLTRDVLDGVPVAVVTTDESLRVTLMNRAACSLVGTMADRCIGSSIEDALALPSAAAESLREVRDGRSRGECVYSLGGTMPREIGVSMRRATGEHGFFIVLRDVAESRQAERIERLAAVSTMAAGFAHEVRNPLASLRMLCEMLQAELHREDPHQELVSRMMNQVARVERLVRTSLQFARPQKPRTAEHWPSVIINAVLEALAPRLRAMSGELELDVQEDLPKIECDDAQLVQVLVVLTNNALDASSTTRGVVLRVSEHTEDGATLGKWVRFSVEDSGPGVPEHLRAAVFHPFFTTKPSGTGLGLSIAQQLVHENGGRIELGAKAGRGAVFSVLIRTRSNAP